MTDLTNIKLTNTEKKLLKEFEDGVLVSVGSKQELKKYKEYAKRTVVKRNRKIRKRKY